MIFLYKLNVFSMKTACKIKTYTKYIWQVVQYNLFDKSKVHSPTARVPSKLSRSFSLFRICHSVQQTHVVLFYFWWGKSNVVSHFREFNLILFTLPMANNEEKRLFVGNLPPDIEEHEIKTEFSYYGKYSRIRVHAKSSSIDMCLQSVYIQIRCFLRFTGAVNKVEIKQKKATDTDEVQSSFAFVTITTDEQTLRQCLQEFKSQQFRGRYLQVTVARENFLEKLKREREEAAQVKKPSTSQSKNSELGVVKAVLPTISTGDSDESDDSSSDESSEDERANQNASAAKPNGVKKFKSSSESSDSSDSDHDKNDPDNLVLRKKSKIFLENGKVSENYWFLDEFSVFAMV